MIKIRHEWNIRRLPINYVCANKFNIDLALIFKKGNFVTLMYETL